VVADPEYAEIASSMRRQLLAGWDGAETERKILESQRLRIFLKSALETGRFTPWDYQPFQDASRRYVRRALPPTDDGVRVVATGREVPAVDGQAKRPPRRIMRT
jgi:choline-sulfatase